MDQVNHPGVPEVKLGNPVHFGRVSRLHTRRAGCMPFEPTSLAGSPTKDFWASLSSGSRPHITISTKTSSFHCTASSADMFPFRSIESTNRQTGKRSSGVSDASVRVMLSTQRIYA